MMNASGRRSRRRFLNRIMRMHKEGRRGHFLFSVQSKKYNFQVSFGNRRIVIEKYNFSSACVVHLDLWESIPTLSFLEEERLVLDHNSGCIHYPRFRVKNSEITVSPYYSIEEYKMKMSFLYQEGSISLDELLEMLEDQSKVELLWKLDEIKSYFLWK